MFSSTGRSTPCPMAEHYWLLIIPQTRTRKPENSPEICFSPSFKKPPAWPIAKVCGAAGRIVHPPPCTGRDLEGTIWGGAAPVLRRQLSCGHGQLKFMLGVGIIGTGKDQLLVRDQEGAAG